LTTKKIIYSLIFTCFIAGYQAIAQKNTYSEDLSVHTYTFEPINIAPNTELKKDTAKQKGGKFSGKSRNEQLQLVTDSVISKNKNLTYSTGYRVLVYSGPDRVKAMECRKTVLKRFPKVHVYAIYHQPDWRIKVGDYDNRLEIQKMYTDLQADFPNAMIVPDQIFISTDKPAAKLQEEPILEVK
jgi:hypothetical protein